MAGIEDQIKQVAHLVTNARLQAQEADIRARFAATFAERALSEARSAHQVAESLAKTSRVVASLALEIANNTDCDIELTSEPYNEDHDTNNNDFDECQSSPGKTGESLKQQLDQEQDDESADSSCDDFLQLPNGAKGSSSLPYGRFQASFPPDLIQPPEHLDGPQALSPVWEGRSSKESSPVLNSLKRNGPTVLEMERKLQELKLNKEQKAKEAFNAKDNISTETKSEQEPRSASVVNQGSQTACAVADTLGCGDVADQSATGTIASCSSLKTDDDEVSSSMEDIVTITSSTSSEGDKAVQCELPVDSADEE